MATMFGSGIRGRGWGLLGGVLGLGLVLGAVLGSGIGGGWFGVGGASAPGDSVSEDSSSAAELDRVRLTAEEAEREGIALGVVSRRPFARGLEAPGVIEADHDLYVEIRSRVSGVAREVRASVGARYRRGDVLAIVDSPELAAARLNLRAKLRERQSARFEADWQATIEENVAALLKAIEERPGLEALEARFAGRPLGTSRQLLLSAHLELETALAEEGRQRELARREIVSEPRAAEAERRRGAARARLEGAMEQARHDSRYARILAEQRLALADSEVEDARKLLEVLGDPRIADIEAGFESSLARVSGSGSGSGSESVSVSVSRNGVSGTGTPEDLDWTAYPVVAPFDGTVLDRPVAPSQRVTPEQPLFSFADLSRVHLVTQIAESDLGLLPRLDEEIRFTTPAFPGEVFRALTHGIGGALDPTTRTAPVIADVENREGKLRIGMFVRTRLTMTEDREVTAAPESAFVEIEGRTAVFAPDAEDPEVYVRRFVKTGAVLGDHREVLEGLSEGERVVVSGTHVLKNELILESLGDED